MFGCEVFTFLFVVKVLQDCYSVFIQLLQGFNKVLTMLSQAAIDAAKKFKYKPRVVNGVATEVSGVQNRITFKIDG